jgi:hypothetical protein
LIGSDRIGSLLRDLSTKIDLDRDARRSILAEILEYSSKDTMERSTVALIAIDLDRYYTSVEATFDAIDAAMDTQRPQGRDWHRVLLHQMTLSRPGRPAVIGESTREALDGLRRFRHFLRHAYAVSLDWQKMRPLVDALVELDGLLEKDLREFDAFIETCLDSTT